MKTSQKILDYIIKNSQASGKELADYLEPITPRAIRKQLKSLLASGKLRKIGRPPKVFYLFNSQEEPDAPISVIPNKVKQIIDKRYLFITPIGEMKPGWDGFAAWCKKTKQDPTKTAGEYVSTLHKYDTFVHDGLIDGMKKIQTTFRRKVFLDLLFYVDFYSIDNIM